jgi:hypothetical protein
MANSLPTSRDSMSPEAFRIVYIRQVTHLLSITYFDTFVSTLQLAIHLRSATLNTLKDSIRGVLFSEQGTQKRRKKN